MAYELANYWGGVASPAQLAALAKARAARAAQRDAERGVQVMYKEPLKINRPAFEYSEDVKRKTKRCRDPTENPNRSAYMGCKLRVLHKIPCEYRTKENIKALTPWAAKYCPSKQRKMGISSAMAQVKKDAKAAGIRVTRVNAKGKRVAKSKSALIDEINFSRHPSPDTLPPLP